MNKVRIAVPKEVGDEITISYGGDDPITYKVTDSGHVSVEADRVDAFLSSVEGAKADAGNPGVSTPKEG